MSDYSKTKEELIAELTSLREEVARLRELSEASAHRHLQFQKVLELAADAIVIVNEKGEIMITNARAETLFGYSREEMIGKTVEMLLPERFRQSHQEHRQHYQAKPYTRGMGANINELLGRRKDGSEFPVEISLSPMEAEDSIWVYSTIRDISARKDLESDIKRTMQKPHLSEKELAMLEGILSICSSCHKIHDESDDIWKTVEQYILEHSDAVFSHGICPTCFKELYPQFYKEYLENNQ